MRLDPYFAVLSSPVSDSCYLHRDIRPPRRLSELWDLHLNLFKLVRLSRCSKRRVTIPTVSDQGLVDGLKASGGLDEANVVRPFFTSPLAKTCGRSLLESGGNEREEGTEKVNS